MAPGIVGPIVQPLGVPGDPPNDIPEIDDPTPGAPPEPTTSPDPDLHE